MVNMFSFPAFLEYQVSYNVPGPPGPKSFDFPPSTDNIKRLFFALLSVQVWQCNAMRPCTIVFPLGPLGSGAGVACACDDGDALATNFFLLKTSPMPQISRSFESNARWLPALCTPYSCCCLAREVPGAVHRAGAVAVLKQ